MICYTVIHLAKRELGGWNAIGGTLVLLDFLQIVIGGDMSLWAMCLQTIFN